MKNTTLAALCVAAAAFAHSALAADPPAGAASAAPMAQAGSCESMADAKKLNGAARNSYVKKCHADAGSGSAACDKQAMDKKLYGAAKNSFVKKCSADAAMAK